MCRTRGAAAGCVGWAIFGKKTGADGGNGGDGGGNGAGGGGFNPDKARVFFDRAKTTHDTLNYPYAAQLWLNGLAQDPSSVEGFQGFFNSIQAYVEEAGKKANGKEIAKGLSGQGQILKYQQAILNWGLKPTSGSATLKAAEASAGLGLTEITQILGQRAMQFARQDEKPRKDVWVKLLDIFDQADAFDLAVEAGQTAMNLDPSDGNLAGRVKEMLAAAAIKRGKFEETKGEAGGFRKNIRDADKQAQLRRRRRNTRSVRRTSPRSRRTGGRCWTGASRSTRRTRCCCSRRRTRRRGSSGSASVRARWNCGSSGARSG